MVRNAKVLRLPNRLGYVTRVDFSYLNDAIDVTSFADVAPRYTQGIGGVELNMTVRAPATEALRSLVHSWVNDGVFQPTYQEEFMCLWCGSPNSIEHTHCKKCGAPRSFIIG